MKNNKTIVISTLLFAIFLLSIGTIAYFRRTVRGNFVVQTGNLNLVVNDANAVKNETFTVSLNRSEEEPYIYPDDKGSFEINIDSNGSSLDVYITVSILKTNLPKNLKFYTDEEFSNLLAQQVYKIEKSDDMTLTIPVYWFWDGSKDDENDSLFIGETLEANISVTASYNIITFRDILLEQPYTLDTNVNFSKTSSSINGIGLMMRDGTQNDEYPIVYYRGNVSNNNVIFADLCWLIVRTTETGGIKLVFNGPVVENADGTESCTNYSGVGYKQENENFTNVFAGNTATKFNESYDSPVYAGYMYNDRNKYYTREGYEGILDTTGYKAHLADNNIDPQTGRHVQNLKDSMVKKIVDEWYETNILGKSAEGLLEDTVWCNDRSVISETYSIENVANGTNSNFHFAARTRLYDNTTKTPSLVCTRDMDKFTVDSANGNGDLDYPIGMLTADEINLAGHPYNSNITTYLTLYSEGFWSLSPYGYSIGLIAVFGTERGGSFVNIGVDYFRGVRPAISLKNNVIFASGNGEFATPYIVG